MAKRIRISKTAKEWKHIQSKIPGGDVARFLNKEISRMLTTFKKTGEYINPSGGELIRKGHYTTDEVYNALEDLSKKIKKPVAKIVDEVLVNAIKRQSQ